MTHKFQPFTSKVISGRQLGRTIGFPTANLALPQDVGYEFGVYFARIEFDNKTYYSLLSIGIKPTIGADHTPNAECYILDFSGDLYGKVLEVEPLEFLRPEQRFNSLDELQKQIQRDELHARELLAIISKLV